MKKLAYYFLNRVHIHQYSNFKTRRLPTSIFDIADLMCSQKQVSGLLHSEAIVFEDLT